MSVTGQEAGDGYAVRAISGRGVNDHWFDESSWKASLSQSIETTSLWLLMLTIKCLSECFCLLCGPS